MSLFEVAWGGVRGGEELAVCGRVRGVSIVRARQRDAEVVRDEPTVAAAVRLRR